MDKTAIADLIDRDQFKNLKHKIVFYNLTTETELLVPELVKLISFGPDSISLQIPAKTCAKGHQLEVHFIPDSDRKSKYNRSILDQIPGAASFRGKIIELIPGEGDEKFIEVIIALESYNADQFKLIIETYEKRQDVLDSILTRCQR